MLNEPTHGGVYAPAQLRVERQGSKAEPYVIHHPQVRGGICEFCGVLDNTVPSEYQYRLCPHYRGTELACSYCDGMKNPDEVVKKSTLNVMNHPDKPGTVIVVCDSYECSRAHQTRFQRNVG